MAIIYPLTPPTSPGFRRVQFAARSVAGITASPFTGQQQVYSWPGEWWEATAELPAMLRADAEAWIAFLASLRGVYGTFNFGDPAGRTPRGVATGSPVVYGAAQSGTSLLTAIWAGSQAGILKAGDYLQICKNYITKPRAFDDALWNKTQCSVTATNIGNPVDGTAEAERVTPDGGATDAQIYIGFTPTVAASRILNASVWLKAASGTPSIYIFLYDGVGGGASTLCNLTASWQRFTVALAFGATATAGNFYVGGSASWVVAEGPIDMWGATAWGADQAARLHKVLTTAASDANGKATLDIFPRLRESPTDFSAIITASPVGTFRLAENRVAWDIDEAKTYGIGFKALEAF
jgi:hypothetical protein